MAHIKPKTTVQMKMTAKGETHARSRIATRDVEGVIDEPLERDGTNQGLTPTEGLMASLMGCTNVISKRIARKMGVEMGEMRISLTASFDRRGAMLEEEVETPFGEIAMDIEVATDATPEQVDAIRRDLSRFCPVAKVIRAAGTVISENWSTAPLRKDTK